MISRSRYIYASILAFSAVIAPLTIVSCTSRALYFTESPLLPTRVYDEKYSSDWSMQDRLIQRVYSYLREDIDRAMSLIQLVAQTLKQRYARLPSEYHPLGDLITNYAKAVEEQTTRMTSTHKSEDNINQIDTPGQLARLTEDIQQLIAQSDGSTRRTTMDHMLSDTNLLIANITGQMTDILLQLHPVVNKYNDIVAELVHAHSKTEEGVQTLAYIRNLDFFDILANITYVNTRYLFNTVLIGGLFNQFNFFNYPDLAVSDHLEMIRYNAANFSKAYQDMTEFRDVLKSSVILISASIIAIQQRSYQLSALLRLSHSIPEKFIPEVDTQMAALTGILERRKSFIPMLVHSRDIYENFQKYSASITALATRLEGLRTDYYSIPAAIRQYYLHIPQAVLAMGNDGVIENPNAQSARVTIGQQVSHLKGIVSMKLDEIFTRFTSSISYVTDFLGTLSNSNLANLFNQINNQVTMLDNISFNTLWEYAHVFDDITRERERSLSVFRDFISNFVKFSSRLFDVLRYALLLINAADQLSTKGIDNSREINKFLTAITQYTNDELRQAYRGYLIFTQGWQEGDENLNKFDQDTPESSDTGSSNKSSDRPSWVDNIDQSRNVIAWIDNIRQRYLAIYALIERGFIDLFLTID